MGLRGYSVSSGLVAQWRRSLQSGLILGLMLGLSVLGYSQQPAAPSGLPAGGSSTVGGGSSSGSPALDGAAGSGATVVPTPRPNPGLAPSTTPGTRPPGSRPATPGAVPATSPGSAQPGTPSSAPLRPTAPSNAPGGAGTPVLTPSTGAASPVRPSGGTPALPGPAKPADCEAVEGTTEQTPLGDIRPIGQGKTQTREELSPIERLLSGSVTDTSTPLRQFGYDLFTRTATAPLATFAPVTDLPISADYVVGPGDSLNIVLWGGVQDTYQVPIDRNGTITLPRLGVVEVGGLTLDQLQNLLQRRFAEYYPDFRMAVTLGKLRTILVYVVGEVQRPGAYTVSALSTVVNGLFASGGPSKNGSLRRIQLIHKDKRTHTLDLYNFLLQGDKSQDKTLQAGDTIFVPLIGPIAGVAGNVKRPAIYELDAGMTLKRLFDLAGGVTPLGYLQRVQVERVVANEKRIVVDFDLVTQQKVRRDAWQTPIAEGDLVRVLPIIPTPENVVTLEGHVLRPGRYELKPGMRLRDLLPSYRELLPEPYPDYAEILRYGEPDAKQVVVPFKLGALLAGDPTANLSLRPRDTIRIFAKTELVDAPTVSVEGEVRTPGTFPLLSEMRVADLVAKASGVTKVASLERAEILRVTATRDLRSLPFHLGRALRGDSTDNLLLANEDRVVIHNINEQKFSQQVRVVGSVNKPGDFPLTTDMRISDLLFRAGGVQKLAYLDKAELTRHRISQSGDTAIRVEINVAQALAGNPEQNLLLEDFDQLLIRAIPELDFDRTMELRGEVRFPGTYPIQRGERLGSVLRRAGGFTPSAYLRGAIFTRVRVKQAQEKRLQDLLREEEVALVTQNAAEIQAALTPEEVREQKQINDFRFDFLKRLKTLEPDGRIVVRLHPLENFAGTSDDLELEGGDQLTIPPNAQYVNVLGEVYNRTTLLYEPGKTVEYYLKKVGGLKPTAQEEGIYLIQADGTVISNTQNQFAVVLASGKTMRFKDFFTVQMQPGDSIIVPRRIITSATLRTTRDFVQIITQGLSGLGLIVALLAQL